MERLIFIYNMEQAKFILQETNAEDLFRISRASGGDVCVSFFNTYKIKNAMRKWCENKNN